jgi:hypothetical protein
MRCRSRHLIILGRDLQRIPWKTGNKSTYIISSYTIFLMLIFNIKGIVSRDLVVCFWCHSIDLKFLHIRSGSFAFKISFRVEFFDIRIWA